MLQVNGKKFDKNDSGNTFSTTFNECMSLLHKLGIKTLVLVSPDHKKNVNEEGNVETSSGGWTLLRQKYVGVRGEYDVIYYKNSHFDKHGNEIFGPRNWSFNGAMESIKVDENPDLAFFLVFVSPNCELKQELQDFQNKVKRDNRTVFYKIEDKKFEAKQAVKTIQDALKIQNLIYSEEFGLSVENLKVIARSVNIGSLKDMDDNQVRIQLGEYFLKQEKGMYFKDRIKDFLEMVPSKGGEIDLFTKAKSLVVQLEELKLIEHKNIAGNKIEWRTNGGDAIISFGKGRNPQDTLAGYFKENPAEMQAFEEMIPK